MRGSRARAARAAILPAALLAAAAAAAGYAAHHTSPLEPHGVDSVLTVAALAALVALVLAAIAPARRHAPLAPVVVVDPRSATVRAAAADDLEFCAVLHAETLPHGFFVALGPRFLRAYYATYLESPYAVSLVAAANGERLGFVVGTIDPPAHSRWVLRQRGLRLAVVGAGALVSRPLTGIRFARTRVARYARAWRRNRGDSTGGERPTHGAVALLSHVAVVPGAQGAGIGSMLVDAFAARARDAGADRVVLLTLEGEQGAGAFYAARGWREGLVRGTLDGGAMREWTLELQAGRS